MLLLIKMSFGKAGKLLNSSDRSNQKEYYGIASVNRETILINITQLHIKIVINKKIGNTIIDLGATGNFITKNTYRIEDI